MKLERRYLVIILFLSILFVPIFSEAKVIEESTLVTPQVMGVALSWAFKTGDEIESDPIIVDVDGDGDLEVLFGSNDHYLYCISNNGTEEWSFLIGNTIQSSPTVADLDNDGTLEVIVCGRDYKIYCLSHLGDEEWNFPVTDRVNSSPTIADLDADGTFEILFGNVI